MSAASLRDDFLSAINGKRSLLKATQESLAGNRREQEAIDHLYESTFLDIVTRFESFLEDLFYETALGRSSVYKTGLVGAVRGARDRQELEEAMLLSRPGNQRFLQWLPIANTIDRAQRVLRDGRPFSRLDKRATETVLLKEILVIRNAIAHRSGDAQRKFDQQCPATVYPKTPAQLLRSSSGNSTKFMNVTTGLGTIAKAVTARSDLQAWGLLSPESNWRSGDHGLQGTYRCVKCSTELRHPGGSDLPACINCSTGPCALCGREDSSRFNRVAP